MCGLTWIPQDELSLEMEEGFFIARKRANRQRVVVLVPLRKGWEFLDDAMGLDNCRLYMNALFGEGGWVTSELHQMLDLCRKMTLDAITMKPPPMDRAGKRFQDLLARDQAALKVNDETIFDMRD